MKNERSQRYVTEIYALWRGEGAAQRVLIKDFSATGCRVADSIDVEVGSEIILEFFLQEDPEEDATRVLAEVMRRGTDGVGMLFTEVSDGAKEQIDFFLFERFAEANSSTSIPVAPRGEPVTPTLVQPETEIKEPRSQRAMNSFFFEFGDKPPEEAGDMPILEGVVQRENPIKSLSPFDESFDDDDLPMVEPDDDLPLVDSDLVQDIEASDAEGLDDSQPKSDEAVRSLPQESGAYQRPSSDDDVLVVDDEADISDIIHRFDARSKANAKAQKGPPLAPPDAKDARLDESLASLPEPTFAPQSNEGTEVSVEGLSPASSRSTFFWVGCVALLLVLVLVYALCSPFGAKSEEENKASPSTKTSTQAPVKKVKQVAASALDPVVSEPQLTQTLLWRLDDDQLNVTLKLALSASSKTLATYVLTRTHIGEVDRGVTRWILVDSSVHFVSKSEQKKNAAVLTRANEVKIGAPLLGPLNRNRRTMKKHYGVPISKNAVYVSVTTEVRTQNQKSSRVAEKTTTRRFKEFL